MTMDAMTLLRRQMEDEKAALTAALVEGHMEPHEYHRACGVIYGLSMAQRLISEMEVRLQGADED